MKWKEIKEKILFSYMGCDWISIDVKGEDFRSLHDYLLENLTVEKNKNSVDYFRINETKFYLYDSLDHHFDFDPKQIKDEDSWIEILNVFLELSGSLKKEIIFRPEDTLKEEREYYLIRIEPNGNVIYNTDVINDFIDPNTPNL